MNLKVAAVNTLARAIHAALWLPAKALAAWDAADTKLANGGADMYGDGES